MFTNGLFMADRPVVIFHLIDGQHMDAVQVTQSRVVEQDALGQEQYNPSFSFLLSFTPFLFIYHASVGHLLSR